MKKNRTQMASNSLISLKLWQYFAVQSTLAGGLFAVTIVFNEVQLNVLSWIFSCFLIAWVSYVLIFWLSVMAE